ncbi:Na(+)/H(+) antiporter subunit D [Tepidimonas thermarum]|uniref:Na(+)/H(+) antiporter subunit D n=1 Tax=Tepidimonas thermarum TaxID=335431 RepID=A0A554X5Y0_9BURK|nr:monovalent cation/H+ antiporter subunit D [Tepidimonas thermarum]TSE31176.1 Na(+)/H(+) antiporter subunit D [Tepidimonas thermarum]
MLLELWRVHAPVLPVVLPLATAVLLLLLGDRTGGTHGHGGRAVARQRVVSGVSALLGLALAVSLLVRADAGEWLVYRLGEWPAPFGIVLVVDRLSALMLVLTAAVALPVWAYASGGWDEQGRYFHAVFHLQWMGLNGAFVTGDLFNLFVFFEVLLIASYVLLVHGHGRERFRVGVHYVVLNLSASGIFLVALGLLYAVTGTLNMADVGQRVASLQGAEAALAQTAALLLLVVFGLKAALLPLGFWLPATYAAAAAPVAALFAIMTKVGVYAIIRVHVSVLSAGAGTVASATADWLLPLALLTAVVGVAGVLAAHSLSRLVGSLTVASVGTMLAGVALFSVQALSAALYYLLHSTLVVAALFLLVEVIAAQRGPAGDRLQPAPAVREPALLGLLLLLGAASAAGLPPLPGFLGKVMLLQASHGLTPQAWVWAVVIGVGFASVVGLARAGAIVFWHVEPTPTEAWPTAGRPGHLLAVIAALLVMGGAMVVAAAPLRAYTLAAAQQLQDHAGYVRAVLGDGPPSLRPYRGTTGSPLHTSPEERP